MVRARLTDRLTEKDREQIVAHGVEMAAVERQLAFYEHPPGYTSILRPCVPGDGIRVIPNAEAEHYQACFAEALRRRSFLKFVPASGAASRMFKTPLGYLHCGRAVTRTDLERDAARGDGAAAEMVAILDHLPRFAFYEALASAMRSAGLDLASVVRGGDVRELLRFLLTEDGLGYASLPKALLLFHRYPDGPRTALEEHLVEAAHYAKDARGLCHLHFTVSPEHRAGFEGLLARVRAGYERRYGVRYEVGFSVQKPSTDSLAVEADNTPFREPDGALLFRPGGHGALIENLDDLRADVIFVKNIDNVVPDHLKESTYRWKRVLGGLLVELQHRAFAHADNLDREVAGERDVAAAMAFLTDELNAVIPDAVATASLTERRRWALGMLDRPMRVCGMVRNEGEPGGGPFWVRALNGEISAQIVETSQIDPNDAERQAMLGDATHFNPVDLVCGVRDRRGGCFDLHDHVDTGAVFVVHKSKDGRDLKSLELPGLWNGAMADWNSVFVEVPADTFCPVKTVDVLLKSAHQPPDGAVAS